MDDKWICITQFIIIIIELLFFSLYLYVMIC